MPVKKKHSKTLRNCLLSVHISESNNIDQKIKRESAHILCLLQGKLHDINGNTVLTPGEAGVISEIKGHKGLVAFGKMTYLTLNYKNDYE